MQCTKLIIIVFFRGGYFLILHVDMENIWKLYYVISSKTQNVYFEEQACSHLKASKSSVTLWERKRFMKDTTEKAKTE